MAVMHYGYEALSRKVYNGRSILYRLCRLNCMQGVKSWETQSEYLMFKGKPVIFATPDEALQAARNWCADMNERMTNPLMAYLPEIRVYLPVIHG